MTVMERIVAPLNDSELSIVRLLRQYCAIRGRDESEPRLARLVALGHTLRVSPPVCVALASVFQLTEAVLGRKLVTECCCAQCLSHDEREVIRLLSSSVSVQPGKVPQGLSGALAWAVISVRRLCREAMATPPLIVGE